MNVRELGSSLWEQGRATAWLGLRFVPWLIVALGLVVMVSGALGPRNAQPHLQDVYPLALADSGGDGTATDGAPADQGGAPGADDAADSEAPAKADAKAADGAKEADGKEGLGADDPAATGVGGPMDDAKVDAKAPDKGAGPKLRKSEGAEAWFGRGLSFLGIFAFIFLAWLLSEDRKAVSWKLVGVGTALQLLFAAFIFFVPLGELIFKVANDAVIKLLEFTNVGAQFVFASFITGQQEIGLVNFAFAVLPTIIFFSSLMTVLYHLGVMQFIVKGVAWVMLRFMGTSGAESLSAAANIFVGQTEAPLVIKPFVEKMTRSELMTVMTGGFATVAGGVMALYVGMLQPMFPDIAGHLIAASVMSAPAALIIGKIMVPETEHPETMGKLEMSDEKPDANVIEAAARGAGEGLQLALNVAAMILAFIALVAMLNYLLGIPSLYHNKDTLDDLKARAVAASVAIPEGCAAPKDDQVTSCAYQVQAALLMKQAAARKVAPPEICAAGPRFAEKCVEGLTASIGDGAEAASVWYVPTFQDLLGLLFWPIAFIMGVPVSECMYIGQLLGTKVIVNELVAYSELVEMLKDPTIQLSERSVVIATYALCGFANLGSIAIQIGGIGGIAPSRRADLADLGLKAMFAGVLAACMTATIAGILV